MESVPKPEIVFEHIGAARLYNGSIRIDIKTMQAVITAGEIHRLLERWPVSIYDISDVIKDTDATPVGKAWITRSGKAVMFSINNMRYVSPLSQVKGMLYGDYKYANVSAMREKDPLTATAPPVEVQA